MWLRTYHFILEIYSLLKTSFELDFSYSGLFVVFLSGYFIFLVYFIIVFKLNTKVEKIG